MNTCFLIDIDDWEISNVPDQAISEARQIKP